MKCVERLLRELPAKVPVRRRIVSDVQYAMQRIHLTRQGTNFAKRKLLLLMHCA